MRLYLVRHGQALDATVDPARPLSESGIREAEALWAFVGQVPFGPTEVWHSGKTRTRQTAEILVAGADLKAPLVEQAGLAPNDPVEPVAARLAARPEDLCLVGHLPFVGRLASYLTAGQSDATHWAFDPCAILCLDRDGMGRWWCRWFAGPETFPPV